jgi:hypothetical protein
LRRVLHRISLPEETQILSGRSAIVEKHRELLGNRAARKVGRGHGVGDGLVLKRVAEARATAAGGRVARVSAKCAATTASATAASATAARTTAARTTAARTTAARTNTCTTTTTRATAARRATRAAPARAACASTEIAELQPTHACLQRRAVGGRWRACAVRLLCELDGDVLLRGRVLQLDGSRR